MSRTTPAQLITEAAQLRQLAQTLMREKLLAVDTESNSLHAYRERVCLIQFSTGENDVLVDPLALEDLSVLAPIFSNPGSEKIFHAAEYDLIVLQRDFDFQFANLFDTMQAARILGRKKVGLGNMLEEEFGVGVAKRFQRADWAKRPLSRDMLEYARLDTHYLIELRNRLKADLLRSGRWPIAEEDFARMPHTIPETLPAPNGDVWRIKGVRDLNPQQAAVLSELAEYRDQQAQKANQPLFKIIGDKTLTTIAAITPRSAAELEMVQGMTKGQMRRHGQALLAAVQRGLKAKPLHRPRRGVYDEEFAERFEILRNWRKAAARKMSVESDVILPRDIMEEIARTNPKSRAGLEALLDNLPWRRAQFGDQLWAVLNQAH